MRGCVQHYIVLCNEFNMLNLIFNEIELVKMEKFINLFIKRISNYIHIITKKEKKGYNNIIICDLLNKVLKDNTTKFELHTHYYKK